MATLEEIANKLLKAGRVDEARAVAAKAQEQTSPVAATGGDMLKGLGSGMAQGLAGLVDLRYSDGVLLDTGEFAPASPPGQAVGRAALGEGFDYAPQTTAGRYTQSVGRFVPGVMNPMTAVAAGVGSEGAADVANYLFPESAIAEPIARLTGALVAPGAVNVGAGVLRKAITPNIGRPANIAAADRLRSEGVPLTAGQRTGSTPLKYEEATSPRISGTVEAQSEAFTMAAMRRVGVNGLGTPENLRSATKAIGSVFDDVASRTKIVVEPGMMGRLDDALAAYTESVGTQAALPGNIIAKVRAAARSGTPISGSDYMDIWSRLGKQLKSGDSSMREFAHAAREVLDDALQANARTADVSKLVTARQQYRDLLAIEKALAGAGEQAASGIITPARLRTAVAGQDKRGFVQGQRDLGELARAGTIAMKPLPQSGSAPRLAATLKRTLGPMAGGGGVGASVGAFAGGPVGALLGGGLGAAVPGLLNAAKMSNVGQAYLGNQVLTSMPKVPRGIIELLLATSNATNETGSR